jgi:hypothetical protein
MGLQPDRESPVPLDRAPGFVNLNIDLPEPEYRMGSAEKRQRRRYKIREGALIVCDHRTGLELGDVIDLSRDGLSFEYFGTHVPVEKRGKMGILLWNSEFYIADLPYRIVSDHEITAEEGCPVPLRQCRVRFGLLSKDKITEIETFIHFYGEDAPA